MKTRLFLFLVSLVLSLSCSSQESVYEPYSFDNCSKKVKNITGWSLNRKCGHWVSNKKFIYPIKQNHYDIDIRKTNNIHYIQTKSFKYNNKTIYLFAIAFKEYRKNYISQHVYVLNEEEFSALMNLTNYKCLNLNFVYCRNFYNVDDIVESLIIPPSCRDCVKYDKCYNKTNNVSTFVITRYNDIIMFNYENPNTGYGRHNDKAMMRYEYFEIPIKEWNKLKIK